MKLDTRMTAELLRIASFYPKPAGDYPSTALAEMAKAGLVRRFKEPSPMGGGGAIGSAPVEWKLVEMTDDGWLALKALLDEDDGGASRLRPGERRSKT